MAARPVAGCTTRGECQLRQRNGRLKSCSRPCPRISRHRPSRENWQKAEVRRGDVYWADLAPRSGSEQQGRRPVIVLSHDGFNQIPAWKSTIVVPLTTSAAQQRHGPTVVEIPNHFGGPATSSYVICHQVNTVDRAKLTRRIGTLPPQLVLEVERD